MCLCAIWFSTGLAVAPVAWRHSARVGFLFAGFSALEVGALLLTSGQGIIASKFTNIFSFCDGVHAALSASDMPRSSFFGNDRFHKIFSQKNPFGSVHRINSRINVMQFMLLIKKVIKRPLHLVLALF